MSTCQSGKTQHPSPQSAQAVLDAMNRRPEGRRRTASAWCKARSRIYKCEFCGAWHIGHAFVQRGRA